MSEKDERERINSETEDEPSNYGEEGGSSQWAQTVLKKDGVHDRTVSRDRKPVSGDENPHEK